MAFGICRDLGDQDGETAALTNLGITLEQPGRAGRMKSAWRVTREEGPEVYRKRPLAADLQPDGRQAGGSRGSWSPGPG